MYKVSRWVWQLSKADEAEIRLTGRVSCCPHCSRERVEISAYPATSRWRNGWDVICTGHHPVLYLRPART